MIDRDNLDCCDMRRAKRLARLMRKELKKPAPVPQPGEQWITITLPPTASNVTYRPMTSARWRNLPRAMVREARGMGLPRYPRDVKESHD